MFKSLFGILLLTIFKRLKSPAWLYEGEPFTARLLKCSWPGLVYILGVCMIYIPEQILLIYMTVVLLAVAKNHQIQTHKHPKMEQNQMDLIKICSAEEHLTVQQIRWSHPLFNSSLK